MWKYSGHKIVVKLLRNFYKLMFFSPGLDFYDYNLSKICKEIIKIKLFMKNDDPYF